MDRALAGRGVPASAMAATLVDGRAGGPFRCDDSAVHADPIDDKFQPGLQSRGISWNSPDTAIVAAH